MPNATALVMGKGRKQRMVPIGRTALKYLENYLNGIRHRLHVYAGRAGIGIQVTPHTFRRSCTTEMLRSGANMYHVKEMLVHESLDTLKHYVRLTITDLKKTHAKCHPREKEGIKRA